jgi:hypothetical protein
VHLQNLAPVAVPLLFLHHLASLAYQVLRALLTRHQAFQTQGLHYLTALHPLPSRSMHDKLSQPHLVAQTAIPLSLPHTYYTSNFPETYFLFHLLQIIELVYHQTKTTQLIGWFWFLSVYFPLVKVAKLREMRGASGKILEPYFLVR